MHAPVVCTMRRYRRRRCPPEQLGKGRPRRRRRRPKREGADGVPGNTGTSGITQGLRFHFAGNRYIATSSEIKTLGLFPTCADGRTTVMPFLMRRRPMVDDCTIWPYWIIPNAKTFSFPFFFFKKKNCRMLVSFSFSRQKDRRMLVSSSNENIKE